VSFEQHATAAVLVLVVTIALMTWVAGRIYKAGVLLYGQKAGIRRTWRAIREGQ
jgi:ABC-type Na+ efflux pump permease subunit